MAHSINIGNILAHNSSGATPDNITAQMRHWKDSVKDFGGYWNGGGTYWTGDNDPLVTRQEAIRFFMTRIGSHIVRGGLGHWEGRISRMILDLDGQSWVIDLDKVINRLQLVYTSYNANGTLDGSAELSTQADFAGITNRRRATYNGVVTYENRRDYPLNSFSAHPNYPFPVMTLATDWASNGSKSVKISALECERDGNGYSGGVEFFTDLAAEANSDYALSCDVKVLTTGAHCSIAVEDETPASQGDIFYTEAGPSTLHLSKVVRTRGTVTGDLRVVIMSSSDSMNNCVFHVDNVQLREFGNRKDLDWLSDADSIAEFGTHEESVVVGGMTDAEAVDRQAQVLAALAWPRPRANGKSSSNSLTVEASGYIMTLSNTATVTGGIKTCTQHLTDLLAHSEFITAGALATNAAEKYIDEIDPQRLWDAIQDVLDRGGASGTRYMGGVYAGRKFNYEARPTTIKYVQRGVKYFNPDNSEANPETMMPGIVYNEGWPKTTPATTIARPSIEDDPRHVYVSAWEFDGDTNTATPIETRELLE